MRLMAAYATPVALLALVRHHEPHSRRFADDVTRGLDTACGNVGNQAPYTDAADFLVVGQREVQRALEPAAQEHGYMREPDRRETLHVGSAAAIQPVTDLRCLERWRVPGLAVDGHHVSVPREHDPAPRGVAVLRWQRREQVGFAPV